MFQLWFWNQTRVLLHAFHCLWYRQCTTSKKVWDALGYISRTKQGLCTTIVINLMWADVRKLSPDVVFQVHKVFLVAMQSKL